MQSQAKKQAGKKSGSPASPDKSWHPPTDLAAFRRFRRILCRQASWRWTSILLLVFLLPSAFGQDLADTGIAPANMQTGSLLMKMKNGYAVATRMNTSIDARVNGIVARITVRQEFRNDGAEWIEGIYVYPLPDKAAVDHLRMYIGDRFIEGDIQEKAKAKKAYEAARANGQKASLVEQQRANMFTTAVANVAPGETVVIEIEYLETIACDDGVFSLRFPVTITPRYIPGQALPDRQGSGWSADTTLVPDASLVTPPVVTRSREHMLTFSADVNAGVPLAFVASRYHVIDVSNTGDRYHIELGDGTTPMDHDLELTWKPVTDGAPRALLFTEDVQGETHALLMMLPPDEFEAQAPHMKRELIFVIDTSGSMHGTSLEQAKRALALALSGLHMGDRFNVIQFNSSTSALFGHSVEANALNIASARRYVSGLTANGGTEMRPALSKALLTAADDAYLRQVIFITDGSVGDEDELYRLIENRLGSTRLFTVGIGSAPNSWFMRKAAEAGRGTFTTIGALHEVNEKMERLFSKLEQPQVTDIAVDWPGGSAVESYPPAVPDLYAGEPVVVRARIGNATDGVVRISGQSLLGGWEVALELGAGVPNSGIAALWARSKIEHLMDGERSGAGEDETRRAIVATAMAHHLVSKYTSLVAIDKTPVRPAAAGVTSEQVPNLLPYGQSQQAIFGFTATATGAPLYRANGIALLLLALLLTLFYLRGEFRHDKAAHG